MEQKLNIIIILLAAITALMVINAFSSRLSPQYGSAMMDRGDRYGDGAGWMYQSQYGGTPVIP